MVAECEWFLGLIRGSRGLGELNMLVLSRKEDQTIWIGPDIRITVLKSTGSTVRLGIEAPEEFKILREELVPNGWGEVAVPAIAGFTSS